MFKEEVLRREDLRNSQGFENVDNLDLEITNNNFTFATPKTKELRGNKKRLRGMVVKL